MPDSPRESQRRRLAKIRPHGNRPCLLFETAPCTPPKERPCATWDIMVSAPVQSIGGSFVPASAGQSLDVGLHQQLQDALGHSKQKVTVAGLLQKLIQWHQWRALGLEAPARA